MKKKILIIGNSAKEYALAKKLSENHQIFVAPGSDTIKEFATCLDIREDAVTELLEFVLENSIDLTIPVSYKALQSDIVDVFLSNNQQIFAAPKNAIQVVSDKAFMKKTFYKLRIPTPKFGIFEKQNMVVDYIKNLKNPYVLKINEPNSATVFTTASSSKAIVDSFFAAKAQKVIIEDYIWGTPFTFYTITDGYKALPVGSSITYRHSLEGEGGQLTTGMGACVPNYRLSFDNEYFLMDNVIYPILENFEQNATPYVGILGVNALLTDDNNIQVLGLQTFFQDCDCDAILETIDVDLYSLFEACVIGSFSDEIEFISLKDLSATTLVLQCKNKENKENVINGLENLDDDLKISYYSSVKKNKYLELEAENGSVLTLTAYARTLASSRVKAYQEVENIDFKGISYRKDICKSLSDI